MVEAHDCGSLRSLVVRCHNESDAMTASEASSSGDQRNAIAGLLPGCTATAVSQRSFGAPGTLACSSTSRKAARNQPAVTSTVDPSALTSRKVTIHDASVAVIDASMTSSQSPTTSMSSISGCVCQDRKPGCRGGVHPWEVTDSSARTRSWPSRLEAHAMKVRHHHAASSRGALNRRGPLRCAVEFVGTRQPISDLWAIHDACVNALEPMIEPTQSFCVQTLPRPSQAPAPNIPTRKERSCATPPKV